jgi:hypothetical protein
VPGRWDIDERGHGVASAEVAVPHLDRLRSAMLVPDWVTEEPDLHLLPHVQRACEAQGWTVERAAIVDSVLEIDVGVPGEHVRTMTEAAFLLLGTFAEESTHVVTTRHDHGPEIELLATTGVLAGDSRFAPHGHVVRLLVHAT